MRHGDQRNGYSGHRPIGWNQISLVKFLKQLDSTLSDVNFEICTNTKRFS
jgi:hypothetical protein